MATPRKPTAPTAEAVDRFCGQFDDLFCRLAERSAFRHYVIGLLLPRERNKTLTELAALVPGADRQRLHHFLHDAPWDPDALGARRVALWRRHPDLGPHGNGVLIIDETGTQTRPWHCAGGPQAGPGVAEGRVPPLDGSVGLGQRWGDAAAVGGAGPVSSRRGSGSRHPPPPSRCFGSRAHGRGRGCGWPRHGPALGP